MWLPRLPPPWRCGLVAAGIGAQLGAVGVGDPDGIFFKVSLIRTSLSPLPFPHDLIRLGCGTFLCSCGFPCLPTHPLHVPGRVGRGELPDDCGIEVLAPCKRLAWGLPMLRLGRLLRAEHQVGIRSRCLPKRAAQSN